MNREKARKQKNAQDWLVIILCLTAFSDSISVYIKQSPREREKEKKNDKQEPPPTATANTEDPCSTIIQISRSPQH